MIQTLRVDGTDHDFNSLSVQAQVHWEMIRFTDSRIAELTNMQALLTRARNSYIEGLAHEIVKARSGVDLSNLLSD